MNWDEDPVHLLEKEEAANQALVAAAHAGHKQVQVVNILPRGTYTRIFYDFLSTRFTLYCGSGLSFQ